MVVAPTIQVRNPSVDPAGVVRSLQNLRVPALRCEDEIRALRVVVSMIDLTTLEGADTPDRVRRLCHRARFPYRKLPDLPSPAAVCVYPTMVGFAREALVNTDIQIAAVATAFPSGQAPLAVRLDEVRKTVAAGAHEIDMVISRGRFLAGDLRYVEKEIAACKDACGPAHLKVILETGELRTLDNIRRASQIAIDAGADFIKTSTGKVQPAATLEATLVMLRCIREHEQRTGRQVGMKPAGGISTPGQALRYLRLLERELGTDWLRPSLFRIGASSLLGKVTTRLRDLDEGRAI